MGREEIEQGFANAGWELDGGFADFLVIGYSGDNFSLLTHEETWGAEDPLFEILDHEGIVGCWVEEIPTPRQAEELVRERGKPRKQRDEASVGAGSRC